MIHCSATPEGKDYTVEQIKNWFTARGWKHPGYREITHLDGRISVLQDYNFNSTIENFEITNGARGWNGETIHLCYIGGVEKDDVTKPKDTRTKDQKRSLEAQVLRYIYLYPWIQVMGHYQVSNKACPSFDVQEWCRNEICLDEKNIFETELLHMNYLIGRHAFDFGPQELR